MRNSVIDADNMRVLETFEESEIANIIIKYETIGSWEDISIDHDGDLILWETLEEDDYE